MATSNGIKKLIASVVLISLLFAPVSFTISTKSNVSVGLNQAQAASLVFDPTLTAKTVIQWIKDNIARILLEAMKERLLSQLRQKTIGYIKNSGKGIPKIITNWGREMGLAGDVAFSAFINAVGLSDQLCSGWKVPTLLTLNRMRDYNGSSFNSQNLCTLEKLGYNLNSFINNFENGGFVAYNQAMGITGSNPWWLTLNAIDQANTQAAAAKQQQALSGIAGNGFRNTAQCKTPAIDPQTLQPYTISDSDYVTGAWKLKCNDPEGTVTTPGETNSNIVQGSVTTREVTQISNAQAISFASMVTNVIVNSIANKLFDAGVQGLFGTAGNTCDGLFGSALDKCLGLSTGQSCANLTGEDLISCEALNGDATKAKAATLDVAKKAQAQFTQLVNALKQLQQCQIDYCKATTDSTSVFGFLNTCTVANRPMSDTQNKINDANNTLADIQSVIDAINAINPSDPGAGEKILTYYYQISDLNATSQINAANSSLTQCRQDLKAAQAAKASSTPPSSF